jgi:pimeloyl-ACP methyl ester carboxylesterase
MLDPSFATLAKEETIAVPAHVWRAVPREFAELPVGRHATDVKAPVLVLSGGKDPLFDATHHAALLKAFPAAASYIYPAGGHNFLWEEPVDVGARLDGFFGEGS